MTTTTYPFDPTGQAATNLVTGELQTLPVVSMDDYFFIIPKAAPFFRETMVVKKYPTGEILKEGVDYVCTHMFYAATYQSGRPVYGSVTFYDHTLTGSVSMTYQTVGGDWTISDSEIVRILTSNMVNPRITTWEQITSLPFQFPPIAHEYDIEDFTGAKDIVGKLKSIEDALLQRNQIAAAAAGDMGLHLLDYNNPHKTNKTHVGLGLVDNFSTATSIDAAAMVANDRFMTPAMVKVAIETLVGRNFLSTFANLVNEVHGVESTLNTHISDYNNPHKTSKAHVGLPLVENFRPATIDEAEIGTANDLYLTPAGGRAIAELVLSNIDLASKVDVTDFNALITVLTNTFTDSTTALAGV